MNVKDTVPRSLHSNVVYKFNCAECSSGYVGETSRHPSTRVCEHLSTDKNSNIFKQVRPWPNDSIFHSIFSQHLISKLKGG